MHAWIYIYVYIYDYPYIHIYMYDLYVYIYLHMILARGPWTRFKKQLQGNPAATTANKWRTSVICWSAKIFQIVDSVTDVRKSYACDEMGWAMKSNDLLVGKCSFKKKFKIIDSVIGVRESYSCYEMCLALKFNDLMVGKVASVRNPKLQNL